MTFWDFNSNLSKKLDSVFSVIIWGFGLLGQWFANPWRCFELPCKEGGSEKYLRSSASFSAQELGFYLFNTLCFFVISNLKKMFLVKIHTAHTHFNSNRRRSPLRSLPDLLVCNRTCKLVSHRASDLKTCFVGLHYF